MQAISHYLKQLAIKSPDKLITALNLNLKEYDEYWVGICPVHQGDNDRAFTLFKKSMTWRCHTHHCQGERKSADIFDLIQAIKNCSYMESIELVKAIYDVGEVSDELLQKLEFELSVSKMKPRSESVSSIDYQPSGLISVYRDNYKPYYEDRGYGSDIIKYFEVGYCPDDIDVEDDLVDWVYLKRDDGKHYERPYFAGRAVIPIHDTKGKLVGFSGRSVANQEPKFIHTKGLPKTKVLYNWHRAQKYFEMTHEVIIVESPGVVWSWFRAGFPNVVASLNAYLSSEHVKLLTNHPEISKVTIAYDADTAGRRGRDQAIKMLKRKLNVYYVDIPEGEDYDKMSPEEIKSWHSKRKVVTP